MEITDREYARQLDADDPLAKFRDRFHIPGEEKGDPKIYLCGNSLGLQPKRVEETLERELKTWREVAVKGHFKEPHPWVNFHEELQPMLASIVGARPREVVPMNSLTTNLHLLMVSFYRPTKERYKILVEGGAFPSDQYAVKSQARHHGLDPEEAIIEVSPREGETLLRDEDIVQAIEEAGEELAMVMIGGVNYYTGQVLDMEAIAEAGHEVGAMVGFDLAHGVGNVELNLHDWGADFAAWCTYKYLNSGPGGVAGIFVHERHGENRETPRFAGWWGVPLEERFDMGPEFVPEAGAAGWQLSNSPVLSMAALRASLELFEEAGMEALIDKRKAISSYLLELIDSLDRDEVEVITPRDPERRGAQLSLYVHEHSKRFFEALGQAGVICDYRRPNVIRLAPAPIYNSFEDVWRFFEVLRDQGELA